MTESKKGWLALLLVLMLGAALRLYKLGEYSLWFDEGLSVMYTDDLGGLLPGSERGTDSPLFLFFLYFWKQLGSSLFFIRTLPALFGIGAIWAAYLLADALFGRRMALAVSFLVAIAPIQIYYSQELRTYSLLTFASTMAIYFMVRALQRAGAGNWAGFTAFCIACIYSHYVIGLLFVAMNLYFLLRIRTYWNRLRPWVISHVVMAISFAPWVMHFWRQFSYQRDPNKQGQWVHHVTPYKVLTAFTDFTLGFHIQSEIVVVAVGLLCVALTLFGVLSIGVRFRRPRSRSTSMLLTVAVGGEQKHEKFQIAFLFFGVLGLIVSVSFTLMNVFVSRYFIFASIPYYILLALGLARLPFRSLRVPVCAALLGVVGVGAVRMYQNTDLYNWIGLYSKKPYQNVYETIRANWRPGDLVLHHHENSLIPFEAYRRMPGLGEPKPWINYLLVTNGRINHKLQGGWYPGYENAPYRFVMDHENKRLLEYWNLREDEVRVLLDLRAMTKEDAAGILQLGETTQDEIATALEQDQITEEVAKLAKLLSHMTSEERRMIEVTLMLQRLPRADRDRAGQLAAAPAAQIERAPDTRSVVETARSLASLSPEHRRMAIECFVPFDDYKRIWYVAGYWQSRTDHIFTGVSGELGVTSDFVGEALHWFGVIDENGRKIHESFENMELVENFTKSSPEKYDKVLFHLYQRKPRKAASPAVSE